VRVLMAPLRPLNNITAPAVAVEIAPSEGGVQSLTSPDYQAAVSAGLTSGMLSLQSQLGAAR
jgi:hypothetical protein